MDSCNRDCLVLFLLTHKFQATQTLLPDVTIFAVIEGGNHSNFGYYGFQKGDGESQITREVQHEHVVKLLRDVFLSTVK